MRTYKIITTCLFTLILHRTPAQTARFVTSGTIEFEKTVNTYALIKKGQITGKNTAGKEQQLFEEYQTSHSQFKVFKSTLVFGDHKTLFTPLETSFSTGLGFSIPMAVQSNIIYSDYTAGKMIAQKNLLSENFLLTDSIRKIRWKLTDETRMVAGYSCRRANALVMDSIYVVAFFTENIHVPGGPESFGGLPGMILELALPHENVSWRAVKVTDTSVPANQLIAPKTGKAVDRTGLVSILRDAGAALTQRQTALTLKVAML